MRRMTVVACYLLFGLSVGTASAEEAITSSAATFINYNGRQSNSKVEAKLNAVPGMYLFKQGTEPVKTEIAQDGSVLPGFSVFLGNEWLTPNGIGLSQRLHNVNWDIAQYTGFVNPNGKNQSVSDSPGWSAVQVAPNNSQIGVIIDSDTWPDMPVNTQMPFQVGYGFAETIMPFADSSVAALRDSMRVDGSLS